MIGIVDYGMGNLRSVQKAFERVGAEASVVDTATQIDAAERLVLPGVGAFSDAMKHLLERGLDDPVRAFVRSGRPFLGICLGMQLLFESSQEDGQHEGLGLIGGSVVRFASGEDLKIPQMGWNSIEWQTPGPLLDGLEPGCCVYFVHSYFTQPTDASVVLTETDYGQRFCSAIHHENIYATQFHPEKSQRVGLKMLANFAGA